MNWLAARFELSRGGAAANVKPMEGLRGFAVFLVFLVHYVTLARPWIPGESFTMPIADALFAMGNSGVDLFFVLSGCLIYGSLLRRKQAYGAFMRRRIERIYPVFTVVFLLYLGLSFVFPNESKLPAEPAQAALYLVQNFLLLPGILPIEPMITVAWSLSYEMFYYLAVPVAIELLRLRERTRRWRMTLLVFLASLVGVYCALRGGHVRLVMFVSGMLLFEAMAAGREAPTLSSRCGAGALVLGLAGTLLPIAGSVGDSVGAGILFVAFFALCLSCFQSPNGHLARAFGWTPLRRLGNMSYSYYLLHGLALKAVFLVLPALLPRAAAGAWFFWGLLPLAFFATLVPTAALFLAVERPFSLSPSTERPERPLRSDMRAA
jgi:exopolysaccharide production protein ExoZ